MPITFSTPIHYMYGDRPMRRACRRIAAGMVDQLHDGVTRRTPVSRPPPGVSVMQHTAQRGRLPGTLKRSWRATDIDQGVSPNGDPQFSGGVFTLDPTAPHVEWPTRPHIIRPSPRRMAASVVATGRPRRAGSDPMARLRFVNSQGRVVYAEEVHHPGTQGVHMMRDSLAEVDATWQESVAREAMRIWAREQLGLVR